MSWLSLREYTEKFRVSLSTVRRHIQQGKVEAKKFGRNWFVNAQPLQFESASLAPDPLTEPSEMLGNFSGRDLGLQGVIDFSSKALHHYLILSDKLAAEKDLRLKEKEAELIGTKQELAELEAYTKILEEELEKLKDRPEGWTT